jgi:hypothetical protein
MDGHYCIKYSLHPLYHVPEIWSAHENTVTSVSEDLCAGILARIRYNTAASKQVKLQHT